MWNGGIYNHCKSKLFPFILKSQIIIILLTGSFKLSICDIFSQIIIVYNSEYYIRLFMLYIIYSMYV